MAGKIDTDYIARIRLHYVIQPDITGRCARVPSLAPEMGGERLAGIIRGDSQ